MNFESFKKNRDLFLSSKLQKEGNERVYEFFETKYSNGELIDEGVVSSVVGWLKKKLSPRAHKIEKLGKEYYDWLMSEYNATYKSKNDPSSKDLDLFLRRELISNDIKDKIAEVAGKDVDYQNLANKIVLANTLKAKKDFSSTLLGIKSALAKKYAEDYSQADDKTKDAESKFTEKDDSKSNQNVKLLLEKVEEHNYQIINNAIIAYVSSYHSAVFLTKKGKKLFFPKDAAIRKVYNDANVTEPKLDKELDRNFADKIQKTYCTDSSEGQIRETFKHTVLEDATKSLFQDYKKSLSSDFWGDRVSKLNSLGPEIRILSSEIFFIKLFSDKVTKMNSDSYHPLHDTEIKDVFGETFEETLPPLEK